MLGMAMDPQLVGYYNARPHARICKNVFTRAHTLMGINFIVRPHALWASKCQYLCPLPSL